MQEDKWSNRVLTCGIYLSECKGATWPSHGFPHGTHSLVKVFGKICLESTGVEPMTSGLGDALVRLGLPAPTMLLDKYSGKVLFKLATLFILRSKGVRASPIPRRKKHVTVLCDLRCIGVWL
jgi:hypothetical protein